MERRGFLKGVFGGITSAGIIIAGQPRALELFAAPLVKDEPLIVESPPLVSHGIGEYLYNEHGERVAVVTHINVHHGLQPSSLWDDTYESVVQGLSRFELQAKGIGTLRLDQSIGDNRSIRLRGTM